jgi:hypothetical protein
MHWKCAQTIPRIEKLLDSRFRHYYFFPFLVFPSYFFPNFPPLLLWNLRKIGGKSKRENKGEKSNSARFSDENLSVGSFSFQYTHPFSESGKHFHNSAMCANDSPPRKTPKQPFFLWKSNVGSFSLQYTHPFLWIRVREAFSRFGNARNRLEKSP